MATSALDLALDDTIGALAGTFRYPFAYGYACVGKAGGLKHAGFCLPSASGPYSRRGPLT